MESQVTVSCQFLLVLIPLHCCDGEVVYVTPSPPPNPDCPDSLPCQTLQTYFSNRSLTQQRINLTMVFLTGEHEGVLKHTELKSHSFNATGVGQGVTINCTAIEFTNAVAIYFTNVTLDHWYISSSCSSVLSLEMSSAIMQNQTRVHIKHASNVSGNRIKLENTVFNKSSSIYGTLSFVNQSKGAMILVNSTLNVGQNTNITFVKSHIHPGMYLNYSTLNVESNVCITFFNNLRSFLIKFSAFNIARTSNITFISNSNASKEGVAMFVEGSTMVTEGDWFLINNSGYCETICIRSSNFSIKNTAKLQFINNSAITQAAAIIVYDTTVSIEDNVNMTFINNTANKAGAMAVLSSNLYIRNNTSITFINNSVDADGGALCAEYSTIYFENNANGTFVQNSAEIAGAMSLWSSVINMKHNATMTFINNSANGVGGALFTFSSRLQLSTSMTIMFIGNLAERGGAMALVSSYLEFVGGDSNITFENNSAKKDGGAILVQPDLLQYTAEYVYIVDTHCLYKANLTSNKHIFNFKNNSAKGAGCDVYGASLDWCNGSTVHTVKKYPTLSSIAGDATRVCTCDSDAKPLCTNLSYNQITLLFHPGEVITLLLVTVGGDLGATFGEVHANFRQPSAKILSTEYHQWINDTQCTPVNYTVYSNQSVQMVLSAHSYTSHSFLDSCISDNALDDLNMKRHCKFYSPLHVNLTFLPCPPGLSLQGDPPGCDCYPVLTYNGVKCNISSSVVTLSWNNSLWITVTSNSITFSKHCPFDYCRDTKIIKQLLIDDQCAFNRAGRLCGSCKKNYSLAIGSSHCIYCSHNYNLALLIFFAAAGFLLVFFISALNLTVSQGMINGLIFYANIVWTYKSILFPNEIPSRLIFFKTFIAWLNLDFGIETCFLNGLNSFWKSWMQFVFPFYLWSIVGLMVMLARHSTRLTILFGNKAVPVLATLILLSYMKLLRTAVEVLHFSVLTTYDSTLNATATKSLVWSVDGTLNYFGYPHILLLLAALFTLLFLWLPYTLLLLLIQWLRRISHCMLLRWTTRLNPFYDANFAPLKHKHQYWFGVLLLARGIILVTFASNFSIPQDINLLLLLLFAGLLLFYMLATSLYRSHALLVFQSSFFLNLCFLSGFIIFSHTIGKVESSMQTSAAVISIGVAFLQFCCVILYQIYSLCHSCGVGRRQNEVLLNDHEEQSHAILDISSRHKDQKYSAEKQPLMEANHSDSDGPTY